MSTQNAPQDQNAQNTQNAQDQNAPDQRAQHAQHAQHASGGSRLAVLANREFRLFYIGYGTSLIGTGMEAVAVAFAVLDNGGSSSDLGLVIAIGVVTNIVCLLAGGIVGDRFSRRAVMLASDSVRLLAQGTFAVLVLTGHPAVWTMAALYALHNVGYGFFSPAVVGLVPDLVADEQLQPANVLIGLARDTGVVAGPALAGALLAVFGPGLVLAVDAATYLVSVLALAALRLPRTVRAEASSFVAEVKEGFGAWRAKSWIWTISVACSLFNALVYAPFLVLGPVVAKGHLGGGHSWGLISAAQGLGSVLAAPVLLRWTPRRPVLAVVAALTVWALPDACLALTAPVWLISAAALLGGASLALLAVVWTTLLQRGVSSTMISRVASVDAVVSYALSPVGLLVAAAVAQATGASRVLWAAALCQAVLTAVLLTLPTVRLTDVGAPAPHPEPDPATSTAQPAEE